MEQRMPLAQYFSFVGGVLLALLFILDARFPKLPAASKSKVYPPVIRIYSDHKWPERIVYDTSLPTIVSTSIAGTEDIIQATETVAAVSTYAKERTAYAMLTPSGEQLQTSNAKMRELKSRHQAKNIRRRSPAPRFVLARHPQFGWLGRHFW